MSVVALKATASQLMGSGALIPTSTLVLGAVCIMLFVALICVTVVRARGQRPRVAKYAPAARSADDEGTDASGEDEYEEDHQQEDAFSDLDEVPRASRVDHQRRPLPPAPDMHMNAVASMDWD